MLIFNATCQDSFATNCISVQHKNVNSRQLWRVTLFYYPYSESTIATILSVLVRSYSDCGREGTTSFDPVSLVGSSLPVDGIALFSLYVDTICLLVWIQITWVYSSQCLLTGKKFHWS
jgi:hypothetical protein